MSKAQKRQSPKLSNVLDTVTIWTDAYFDDVIQDTCFEGVTIEDVFEPNIKFDGCVFKNCSFENWDITRIECLDVCFDHCEFNGIHINASHFQRVEFIDCRLMGLEITDSALHHVLWSRCNSQYANYSGSSFKNALLEETDLANSAMIQSQFKDIEFKHCKLKGAEFYNTELNGIDLSTSDISNVGVSEDLLKGVIVSEEQALEFVKILGIIIKG